MRYKVSDYIVERLAREGVNTVFGYQGGNISHLIDSIGQSKHISFVEMYHEQGAAFAANSYAQVNHTVGVAVASSGPGAINLLNGIANAYCDSIPCIFFTGDVNTSAKRPDGSLRQNAFQEVNILPMVEPITKFCISVDNESDIVDILENAIFIAQEGRKGPVLINLPHDIQRNYIDVDIVRPYCSANGDCTLELLPHVLDLLKQSLRPIVIVGGGMRSLCAQNLLRQFLEKVKIPVVASLLGLDVLPHGHDCYRGFIGSYGNRGANLCLQYSDCVLVLGSRLDDRQIPSTDKCYFEGKTIIHVDIDPRELCLKLNENISLESDCCSFLKELLKEDLSDFNNHRWLQVTRILTEKYPSYDLDSSALHPNNFLRLLSKSICAVYTLDVGNNQMHSAQSLYVDGNTQVLSSGGLGSMGYSLPAAIGACYANGIDKVISINGDGGFQMNIQELQTVMRCKLPVNVVVLNNNALGMIYHMQKHMFENRYYGTIEGYCSPNLRTIADAYGFKYLEITSPADYSSAIELLTLNDRVLVDFNMDVNLTTIPELGKSIFKQMPQLSESEININNNLVYNETN